MNRRKGSFRESVQRFMYGRYGQIDALNKFLFALWFVFYLFSIVLSRVTAVAAIFSMLSTLAFLLVIFRMFSRNVYKRSAENMKYFEIRNKITGIFKRNGSTYDAGSKSYKQGARTAKVRPVRDPAYKYFKCVKCKKTVRVPKNHGKVELKCKNCGHVFVRYTGKRVG